MPLTLMTKVGEKLTGVPWTEYPRPQMRRENWINLNGTWEFYVNGTRRGDIQVPFCPESQLSGVGVHFEEGSVLSYRREVCLPESYRQGRILLHVGAADQVAEVFVNGRLLARHEGGYEAFTLDITEGIGEKIEIQIQCRDNLRDQSFPYGKQVMERGGMWYTPTSGIWQTVWLENVPESYIEKLHVENRGGSVTISLEPALDGLVSVEGLGEFPLHAGRVTITSENPHFWSPEDPHLYPFTVQVGTDRVESYFALRTLEIKTIGEYPRLCLNGQPYFFHGLLDQGYWPEGLLTPPSGESYAEDILAMKKLGFNTLRKHIKVEMEEFYYQCDKLGMIVFQDMVNNGEYNFLRDTALPTAGIQKLPDKNLNKDENTRRRFLEGMEATVKQLKNHPCICYWTIFNEGWGQFDSDRVFREFKKLDDTRFVDSTSGWFRQRESDVDSRHVYFRKVKLKGDGKLPLVLSEFGGKVWKSEGHSFNPEKTYGYGSCKTREELEEALVKLYMEEILPAVRSGLCAAIYTQVSDVEDEVNGLLTYDRKVEKVRAEVMRPVAQALAEAVK